MNLATRISSKLGPFAVIALLATLPVIAVAENIVFPAAANIVDVTQPPYNADKTGVADSTAALQAALNAFPNGNRIIYLPNGTYRVSNTLRWGGLGSGGNEQKRIILQGQSRDGTIVKLIDNCAGFTSSATPKEVIWTGVKPAQRFRNAIRNLTIDTGSGNAGAVGVRFIANNQGGVFDVLIKSGDGVGVTGLDMAYTDEIGPLMVKNVEVRGFAVGVRTANSVNSMTFENLTLSGQSTFGFQNSGQVCTIRNLSFNGTVPALRNDTGAAVLTLVGATLSGTGAASTAPAISNGALMYAEDVVTTGYALAIDNLVGTAEDVTDANVDTFVSHSGQTLFTPSSQRSLGLPIEETPDVAWDSNFNNWANVQDYKLAGETDYSAAFQRAIDSGKTTVYFPAFNVNSTRYNFNSDVTIRGAVRRIIGCEAKMTGLGKFIFSSGTAPVVVFERIDEAPELVFNSSRTLALKSCGVVGINASGTGKLFIEDVVMNFLNINSSTTSVWARQLNIEGEAAAKINNQGGTLVVLGYKTEKGNVLLRTTAGGRSELLGCFNYSNSSPKVHPVFEVIDAQASFVGLGEANYNGTSYSVIVRETRNAVTRELLKQDCIGRANGSALTLFTAFAGGAINPNEVIVDNLSSAGVTLTGTWFPTVSPAGYLGINYFTDGNAGKGTKRITYAPNLPSAGSWEVLVRYASGSNRPTAVPHDILHTGGNTTVNVNQTINGARWVSLGTYSFNAGSSGSVTIRNDNTTNRFVVADAVQFRRLVPTVDILVDNTDTANVTFVGSWPPTTSTPGYVGVNYVTDANADKGNKSVTYRPNIPSSGNYSVYTWYTSGSNRPAAVPHDVAHAGGTATVFVNQTVNGSQWVLLGTFSFAAGNSGTVTIRNAGTTNRFVIADAVRFVSAP
jgi:hypothetical protein